MTRHLGLVPTDTAFPVLNLLRSAGQITRTELVERTGLTRKVVTQRLEELIRAGFAEDGDVGRSTGGRAPREVKFRADGAHILVAELAATSIAVGLTDLAGTVLSEIRAEADPHSGPDATLSHVESIFDSLIADRLVDSPSIYGIGISIPGPVEISSGRPVGALSAPEWADYPVRDRFTARYNLPVWVDNDANLMALGELREGLARGLDDVLFVKIGGGIGGAVISSGTLQRGSQGSAGEFGHVFVSEDITERCWCGHTGCLTQVAGGPALGEFGQHAATTGESPILAAISAQGRAIGAAEVFTAAAAGDPVSTDMLTRAGHTLGSVVSVLVSGLNPALILLDAGLVRIDDPYMTAFRTTVLDRSLPSAVSEIQFAISSLGNSAGLIGAAYMVVDELLSPRRLGLWSERGSPVGLADLIHRAAERTT
ncbi:ROK family transcriptional regulator [Rhodococcus marinonascens]|uniref:ROK family transcriptional regulator n=1 Tax=Rhodococcus marinonascens TaxID=38311 RepID=UPI000932CD47|nr:ROK family transcriptional regulator [Rhodococcus marinonascens]